MPNAFLISITGHIDSLIFKKYLHLCSLPHTSVGTSWVTHQNAA